MSLTREEINAKQREWRRANGDAYTKKYEKTRKGKLMRTYRNMMSRVKGIQSKKAHLYEGKSILEREEFYQWSLNDETYNALFDAWVESDYDRRLSPSIDRIDTSRGYKPDNIFWSTHSENSRRGAVSRHSK